MTSADELWALLRPCFGADDGSLPTFEVQNLGASEVARIYSLIRNRSTVVSENPSYWDSESETERSIDDVPNAASLVTAGKAEPFHFSVEGLEGEGAEIPCLGVFVFQDSIAFDYRMGPGWGPRQVLALFSWLKQLIDAAGGARLVPSASDGPPDPTAFELAWRNFRED